MAIKWQISFSNNMALAHGGHYNHMKPLVFMCFTYVYECSWMVFYGLARCSPLQGNDIFWKKMLL